MDAQIERVLNLIVSKSGDTVIGLSTEMCLLKQNEKEAIEHIIELTKRGRTNFYKRKWGREVVRELKLICRLHGAVVFDVEEEILIGCILFLNDKANHN